MTAYLDITGQTYHKLTAVKPRGKNKHGQIFWLFNCECGKEVERLLYLVRSGNTKSCGCLLPLNTPESFWARVNIAGENDCWEWTGSIVNRYGRLSYKGKFWRAHRLAYFLSTHLESSYICHSCDNPICCNPSHLWSGTHEENMADMAQKGRAFRGGGRPKKNK